MKKNPFGKRGDFITSPLVSNLFGEMLAIWCVSFWENIGRPSKILLVELGPGDGSLCKDLLNSFKQFKDFYNSLEVNLLEISKKCGVEIVYKSSFDKANRTSLNGARGLGIEQCIPIFSEIREKTGLPVMTDVHETDHCIELSDIVDVIQIPAFLCRQTDLIVAAANDARTKVESKIQQNMSDLTGGLPLPPDFKLPF